MMATASNSWSVSGWNLPRAKNPQFFAVLIFGVFLLLSYAKRLHNWSKLTPKHPAAKPALSC